MKSAVREDAKVVRSSRLGPQDLVHTPQNTLALPAGAEGGGRVAGHPQPVRVVVHRAKLRVLAQLGQTDQLLVKSCVLLDLVAAAWYLHFYPILLLLLEKVVLLVSLVVGLPGWGVPRSGSQLARHGGVRSRVGGRVRPAAASQAGIGPETSGSVRISACVVGETRVPFQTAGWGSSVQKTTAKVEVGTIYGFERRGPTPMSLRSVSAYFG